jgi:hypothetical protein
VLSLAFTFWFLGFPASQSVSYMKRERHTHTHTYTKSTKSQSQKQSSTSNVLSHFWLLIFDFDLQRLGKKKKIDRQTRKEEHSLLVVRTFPQLLIVVLLHSSYHQPQTWWQSWLCCQWEIDAFRTIAYLYGDVVDHPTLRLIPSTIRRDPRLRCQRASRCRIRMISAVIVQHLELIPSGLWGDPRLHTWCE